MRGRKWAVISGARHAIRKRPQELAGRRNEGEKTLLRWAVLNDSYCINATPLLQLCNGSSLDVTCAVKNFHRACNEHVSKRVSRERKELYGIGR